jgi:hypothetical protein
MFSSAWSLSFAFAGTAAAVGILMMPFALLVVSGILRQRRSPASSLTWLMAILLLPLIGIPLFWLFGSRKIKRIAQAKVPVQLTMVEPEAAAAPHPDMALAAEHLGSDGITRGNKLKFHDGGVDAYADLMTLIDGANVLKADETGSAIVERLTARAKEGVQVRLFIDGFGSFHMARRPLRKLRRAGGKVAFFFLSGVSPSSTAAICETIARLPSLTVSACLPADATWRTNILDPDPTPSAGLISRSCSKDQPRPTMAKSFAMTGLSRAARN